MDDVVKQLGFEIQLKNEQRAVIQSIIEKNDTIAQLPTGYGKSLCYIIPPFLLDKNDPSVKHTSLVISPLKTLIKDQITTLREKNIPAYGLIEGAETEDLAGIKAGFASILFASPEAVLNKYWRDVLTEVYKDRICVVAYDEAHCISEWGLDFRPDYGRVGILQSIIEAPVLVLTATLTTDIRKDIDKALGLRPESSRVIATLPDRPNIFLWTEKTTEHHEEELAWICKALKEKQLHCPKIIIYVNSISLCETLYIWMHSALKSAAYHGETLISNRMVEMYHAHTDEISKARIMEQFISTNSTVRVLIATVACGMGVNIPDIKFAILWGLPSSLLLMWQEIGRCSRDGKQGIALCYAFQRSTSKPCDNCRKNKKFHCKCASQEYLRSLVKSEKCQRTHILRHFLLEGMDEKLLPSRNVNCTSDCDTCACDKCKCCIVCRKQCKCSKNNAKEQIIEFFLEDICN